MEFVEFGLVKAKQMKQMELIELKEDWVSELAPLILIEQREINKSIGGRAVCEWNGGQQRQAKQSIEEIFDLFNWLVASVGPEWNAAEGSCLQRPAEWPAELIEEKELTKSMERCCGGPAASVNSSIKDWWKRRRQFSNHKTNTQHSKIIHSLLVEWIDLLNCLVCFVGWAELYYNSIYLVDCNKNIEK